jgi:hypothetical protein
MSEKSQGEGERVLGEAEVAEILERAIRLDGARDTRVTVEQLREAALEVGVSPAAFAEALAEFGRERAPTETGAAIGPPVSRFRSAVRTGLGVAFGATVGATAGIMDGPYLSEETWALSAILLAGASLRLVLSHKKEKALLPFVLDVIWLWSSFVVAVALVTNALGEESIIATLAGIIISSVVGGWIIRMTENTERSEPPPTLRLELTAPREDRTDRPHLPDG